MNKLLLILTLLFAASFSSVGQGLIGQLENQVDQALGEVGALNGRDLDKLVGRYELVRMRIQDKNFYDEIVFDPADTRVFSEEYFSTGGLKSKFSINPKQTYLEINPNNVCNYKWDLTLRDRRGLNRKFKISWISQRGSQTNFACVKKDKTMESPKHLMPKNKVVFQSWSATNLILRARTDDVEQILYYRRVTGDDGQRVSTLF